MEKFAAWVAGLPVGIRWFFSIVLALAIIGAGIAAAGRNRGSGGSSVPGRSDIDRKVDHNVGIVDDLVSGDLSVLERNRQAMEKRASDILEESERLIAEARAGNGSAKAGK